MDTIVTVTIGINVGDGQDSTQDAIESAQNQIRSMNIEELIRLMHWQIED